MSTVSLTTIVKNEAANLPRMIESCREVVDEIVLVDTGSTDDTVAVAEELGARVFRLPDDSVASARAFDERGILIHFGVARNVGLNHCSSDWILHLDADEWLLPDGIDAVKVARHRTPTDPPVGYCFVCSTVNKAGNVLEPYVSSPRLFPNTPRLRWWGRVHTRIRLDGKQPSEQRLPGVHMMTDGYDSSLIAAKWKRNVRLLRMQLEHDNPEDVTAMYDLAKCYRDVGQTDEAVSWARCAIGVDDRTHELHPIHRRDLLEMLGQGPPSEMAADGTLLSLAINHYARPSGIYEHRVEQMLINGMLNRDQRELARVLRQFADQLDPR